MTTAGDPLVIVGDQDGSPAVSRSLDGTSWQRETSLPNLRLTTLRCVATAGIGLVVVGDGVSGGVVLTSRQAPSG